MLGCRIDRSRASPLLSKNSYMTTVLRSARHHHRHHHVQHVMGWRRCAHELGQTDKLPNSNGLAGSHASGAVLLSERAGPLRRNTNVTLDYSKLDGLIPAVVQDDDTARC